MFTRNGLTAKLVMAMNTLSKFSVHDICQNTATRPNGYAARALLKGFIDRDCPVEVDVSGVVLTPSFADEFLGVLLVELGEERFRKCVKISNAEGSSKALLKQILNRRSAKPYLDIEAHDRLHSGGFEKD